MTPEQRWEGLISKAFENLPKNTSVTRLEVDAILTWVLPDVAPYDEERDVIEAARVVHGSRGQRATVVAMARLMLAVNALNDAEAAHNRDYGAPGNCPFRCGEPSTGPTKCTGECIRPKGDGTDKSELEKQDRLWAEVDARWSDPNYTGKEECICVFREPGIAPNPRCPAHAPQGGGTEVPEPCALAVPHAAPQCHALCMCMGAVLPSLHAGDSAGDKRDPWGRVHLLVPERARMACGRKIGEHWGSALNREHVNCPDCLAVLAGDTELCKGGALHGPHPHDGSICIDCPTCVPAKTSPLIDRRQRAREAFWDTSGHTMTGARDGIEEAVETATRVQLSADVMSAARGAFEDRYGGHVGPIIKAAFQAAGFEVVE